MSNTQNTISAKKISKLEKLVSIELTYSPKLREIKTIKITGDFFLHPEETIENLEDSLCGTKLEREEIRGKIKSALKNSKFYGFDVTSLCNAILECVNER